MRGVNTFRSFGVRLLLCSFIVTALTTETALPQTTAPRRVKISFTNPAYAGMPIWVTVDAPLEIHYPVDTAPSEFGCNSIEVKLGERLLRPEIHPNPAGKNGAVCGWVSAPNSPSLRLPLHIQYPLSEPGTYMVRYTRHGFAIENGRPVEPVLGQSDWTPLQVKAPPAGERERWLSNAIKNLPTTPGLLVGDALPSLLASRDPEVFRVMLQATYNADEIVSKYASNTMPMFDPTIVRTETRKAIRDNGPDDALAYAFSSYGNVLLPIAEQVVATSVSYLHSAQPTQVASAAHMLHVLKDPYYRLSSETSQSISSAMEGAVDVVVAQKNEKAASWLAQHLATSKSPRAHELLWKLADARLATEQSLICITWLHDTKDLPKITAIVETYDSADPYGYQNSGVVGDLRYGYGSETQPYLRDILSKSKQVWVRAAAAKELALMNDSAGYEFFVNTLEEHPFYHDEMVGWLKGAFPEIKNADKAAILRFLKARMANR